APRRAHRYDAARGRAQLADRLGHAHRGDPGSAQGLAWLHMASSLPRGAVRVEVTRQPTGALESDTVAWEEPLEIRIGGEPVAVTMRTPGHDEELALGFCLTEGIPARSAGPTADLAANTVEVDASEFERASVQRSFYTSSSCGVCGKGALEAVAVSAPRVES